MLISVAFKGSFIEGLHMVSKWVRKGSCSIAVYKKFYHKFVGGFCSLTKLPPGFYNLRVS